MLYTLSGNSSSDVEYLPVKILKINLVNIQKVDEVNKPVRL